MSLLPNCTCHIFNGHSCPLHGLSELPEPLPKVDGQEDGLTDPVYIAMRKVAVAAMDHSCNYKTGHPNVTEPCPICKAVEEWTQLEAVQVEEPGTVVGTLAAAQIIVDNMPKGIFR